MENFTIVKKGYNPQEVDEYIETLEKVVKSYKDKDNAIKNAIISAQIAADNIIKNAEAEAVAYRAQAMEHLKKIFESVETQRSRAQSFQDEYNDLLHKYLRNFEESDISLVYDRIDELEKYLQEISDSTFETEAYEPEPQP